MFANVRPESAVFEFLDRLGLFVRENSLGFLIGIIAITIVGGLWLLFRLRRCRTQNANRAFTASYGIILGGSSNTKPDEPPPPLTDPRAAPSDDLRD
ncbi:MAG: hypothetical protein L0Z50_07615 [Verrucomicrobiales bacterium]|nr:hypothetical protein [Verrucomicrobiales bacterium]